MPTLSPKTIEPGHLARWLKRSFAVLGRNFHIWFALSLAFCALCHYLRNWSILALLPLGVLFSFFSSEMAELSFYRSGSLLDVIRLIGYASHETMKQLWAQRWRLLRTLLLFVVVVLVYAGYLLYRLRTESVEQVFATSGDDGFSLWTWIFGPSSPLQAAAYSLIFGNIVTSRTQIMGFLERHIMRCFQIDAEGAHYLRIIAVYRNFRIFRQYHILESAGILCIAMWLPGLAPILICLVPTVHFIIFKELFDDDGLEALDSTKQAVPMPAHAGSPP
jgi:hypothetical protein